jgi:hypothetical protein
VAAVVAAALIGSASASPQAATTRTLTFKELAKGSTFAFIDNAPKSKGQGEPSASVGDVLTFTNPLVDAAGKRLGRLYMHCTAVVAARRADKATYGCEGAIALRDGTMTVQSLLGAANIGAGRTVTATVTGGTDAYANARGVVVSKQNKSGAKFSSNDTVTLVN